MSSVIFVAKHATEWGGECLQTNIVLKVRADPLHIHSLQDILVFLALVTEREHDSEAVKLSPFQE